ncbi:MAG: hypothetical protein VX589_07160 [Myxococcota bacterium]|nr:hypothetical protein [Myxococcota bacterium]
MHDTPHFDSVPSRRTAAGKMASRRWMLTLGLSVLSLSGPGQAWSAPETRDGFMLRMLSGVGYGHRSEDLGPSAGTVKYAGFHGVSELALGGRVADGFSLHGTVFASSGDQVSIDSRTRNLSAGDSDLTVVASGVGLGGTLFFMDELMYVTATIGLASGHVSETSSANNVTVVRRIDDGIGLGISTAIGREWWVHEEWALGLSGIFQAYWIGPSADELCEGQFDCSRTIQHLAGGIAFSVTYQ